MARLFEARRADNGEAPGPLTPASCRGLTLVFSPDKSVTLAAEFAPTPAESALIWNAIDRAADRAMRCRCPGSRLGTPGKGWRGRRRSGGGRMDLLPASHGPAYVAGPGRAGWADLSVRRAGRRRPARAYPQLPAEHRRDRGRSRSRSLDLRALTDNRIKEFGAYFQAVLADELRRLGIQVGYNENEQAVVIESVPGDIGRAFRSKRDRQILHKARTLRGAPGPVVG